MEFSNKYITTFALVLCLALSLVVSSIATALKDRQERNALLDKRTMVLRVADLVALDEMPSEEKVAELFEDIETMVVDLETGELRPYAGEIDPKSDAKDPDASVSVTDNAFAKKAAIKRVAEQQIVYLVRTPGKESVVFPIYGNGLWSTMYGFLALSPDLSEVVNIIYYDQKETAGLGGEVENPRWLAQWPGKTGIVDGQLQVEVVKNGQVRDPEYQVDGISGSTITSLAVTHMLRFWFSDDAYGVALDKLREAIQTQD